MSMLVEQAVADEEIISRDGYQFNVSDDRWRLNKDVDIPVSAISQQLSQNLYLAFRRVLAFYARRLQDLSATRLLN